MPRTPAQSALSIISPETTGGSPPRDLGRHGRKLWDEVQAAYGISDRGGVELLAQACGTLDLVEALGEAIARDGAIVYGRAGPKAHPAVKDQIAARALLVRVLEKLGVTTENIKPGPGRPPSEYRSANCGRLTSPISEALGRTLRALIGLPDRSPASPSARRSAASGRAAARAPRAATLLRRQAV